MNDVIELLSIITNSNTDENGFEINTENKREVFAEKKSVRSNEFYQAQSKGFKIDIMFNIKPYEYEDEEYLMFENKKYKIERLYEKDTENLELICSMVR